MGAIIWFERLNQIFTIRINLRGSKEKEHNALDGSYEDKCTEINDLMNLKR